MDDLLSKQAEQEGVEVVKQGGDVKTGSRTQGFITNKRFVIATIYIKD